MARASQLTYWTVSGGLFFVSAYLLLWSQSGPWVDGSGYMAALTLPGFEPPPVGFEEYRECFVVRLQYWAPYLAYALASTAAAGAAIRFARAYRLGSIALGVGSVAFLMGPWLIHWTICLALPPGGEGCFTWGEPISLLLFFLPIITPLAVMMVLFAKAEEWVATSTARSGQAR